MKSWLDSHLSSNKSLLVDGDSVVLLLHSMLPSIHIPIYLQVIATISRDYCLVNASFAREQVIDLLVESLESTTAPNVDGLPFWNAAPSLWADTDWGLSTVLHIDLTYFGLYPPSNDASIVTAEVMTSSPSLTEVCWHVTVASSVPSAKSRVYCNVFVCERCHVHIRPMCAQSCELRSGDR